MQQTKQAAIVLAVTTKSFAMSEKFVSKDPKFVRWFEFATLERGLLLGAAAFLADAAFSWEQAGFGPLNYSRTIKWVIPGATLTAIGVQVVLFSFLISMVGIRRR